LISPTVNFNAATAAPRTVLKAPSSADTPISMVVRSATTAVTASMAVLRVYRVERVFRLLTIERVIPSSDHQMLQAYDANARAAICTATGYPVGGFDRGLLAPAGDVVRTRLSEIRAWCPVSPKLARQRVADLRRIRLAETASSWLSHC
jgi:hypothetical protein